MKRSTKALVAGAALAGLMTGVAARTYASSAPANPRGTSLTSWGQLDDTGDKGKHDCKGQNTCKGQGGCKSGDNGCKGQNSCKGKGGCKSSDNGCKGKNSCKGKGGCATDGSKMPG